MARAPVGQRIRKQRQALGLTQTELARRLDISASYLNLIEHNRRRIGSGLLVKMADVLRLDSRSLSGSEEARLIAELVEVAADPLLSRIGLSQDEARDVVAAAPKAAQAVLTLYRAFREARMRSDLIGERLGEEGFLAETSHQVLALITTIRSYSEILKDYGDLSNEERGRFVATLVQESERLTARATEMFDFMSGRGSRRPRPAPREEIEDFFSDRSNYFPHLEAAADKLRSETGGDPGPSLETLADRLRHKHGIRIARRSADSLPLSLEHYDRSEAQFLLSDKLERASVRFRLARLIADLEVASLLDRLVKEAALSAPDAGTRLRRALAGYTAAALVMPYRPFKELAETLRFDIVRLAQRFDVSFEQACHRLTTLRRPGMEGIPLHFLRTDIAGNISKRFSASGLRLPRYGGACPLWVVHRAYAAPGRIVTQVASLPNGETYFSIARAEPELSGASPRHAIMIGASAAHVSSFAYADGINLAAPTVVEPVGVTCRQCPRQRCAHRAFERAPVLDALGGSLGVTPTP